MVGTFAKECAACNIRQVLPGRAVNEPCVIVGGLWVGRGRFKTDPATGRFLIDRTPS